MSLLANSPGSMASDGAVLHDAQRRLRALTHHFTELAGEDEVPLPGTRVASTKKMSAPTGVQASPVATPGTLVRIATSLSAAQFLARLLFDLLGHPGFGDRLGELGNLGALAIVALAELALDRRHLFAQEHLALALIERRLRLLTDFRGKEVYATKAQIRSIPDKQARNPRFIIGCRCPSGREARIRGGRCDMRREW